MTRAQTSGAAKTASMEDRGVQIKQLKSDIATLGESLGEVAQARAATTRDAAQEKADALRELASEMAHQAQTLAHDGASEMGQVARENPAATLGIAAGFGVLFGYLSARK